MASELNGPIVHKMTKKAMKDPAYRATLENNPKVAVEQAMSEVFGREMKLPVRTTVHIHYQNKESVHIVLPNLDQPTIPDLSDAELETIHVLGSTSLKCNDD